MAYSARIDELEKKFSENARRYFAPLANEYRKAGDLDRAIEICRAHLPQQPGHMSGHIVYGQALYESRQLEEAKTVFEAALALDPENLIALRHLGDIARDSSDPATARAWYMRVLDADPRNDDVAAMLAELDAATASAPTAESAPASEGASGWGDINPERAAEGSAGGAAANSQQAAPSEDVVIEPEPDQSADIGLEPMPSDASVDELLGLAGAAGSAAKGQPDAQSARQQPSLDQVLNDAFADADTQEMEAGSGAPSAASSKADAAGRAIAPSGGGEKREERPAVEDAGALGESAFAEVDALFDEIASEGTPASGTRATGESQAKPGAETKGSQRSGTDSDALFGDAARDEDSAAGTASRLDGLETSEFVAPSRATPNAQKPPRTTGSMAVSGLTTFEQPTEEDSSTRAAFVTETMAELYLQQGFTAEALDIYRQLFEQNPDDTNLRDRIAQLERGGPTSLSEAAVSSEVIHAAQQRHAARPVRTARSFFGRLAGQHLGQPVESADTEAEAAEVPEERWEPPAAVRRDTPPPGPATPRRPTPRPEPRVTGSGIAIVSDLFGEAPVSEEDEAAASMLASAFTAFPDQQQPAESRPTTPNSGGSVPGVTTTGRPARAAGRELSLDQVFRDSGTRQPRKSGPFSFDQFFSDGSQGNGPEGTPAPEEQERDEAKDPEGDLEQFTAWLEGLKRK